MSRIEDTWDLTKLYDNDSEWEKDFALLTDMAEDIDGYKGRLSEAEKLLDYLKFNDQLNMKLERLGLYANLKSEEDVTVSAYLAMNGRLESRIAEIMGRQAFFVPEILSHTDEEIETMIDNCRGLEEYRFFLSDIMRTRPHVLNQDSEELLAYASDCMSAAGSACHILQDSDMDFDDVIDENGEPQQLTEGTYSVFSQSEQRQVRKDAFEKLFEGYGRFANTFCSLLTSSVKVSVFEADVRHYGSAVEASLSDDNIPVDVYRNTVDSTCKGLKSLHRYVTLKKKLLGLDSFHLYDLNAPLVPAGDVAHIDFDRGVEMITEALEPMGDEYIRQFNKGIHSRWVDRYPKKGKASGAFSSGGYGTMPYVLMNYNGKDEDVLTLAHEMGHSMHTWYSTGTQPFVYSNYSLFCAEVASVTNETIVSRYLTDHAENKNRRVTLIDLQLGQIRGTLFRQVMFAEFELYIHDAVEKGMQPTTDEINEFWHELNMKYYGPDMIIDDCSNVEWARIPHFYSDFYVYQYATGYAAANAFAEKIVHGTREDLDRYKGFLKSGCSDYPVSILKKAGVDLTMPEPFDSVIRRFDGLMDELEEIYYGSERH